jgi:hypothetical protein
MSHPVLSDNAGDPLLAELIEEITDKLQKGEPVDLEAHIRQHSGHAEELRKLLPALHMLAVAGSVAGSDEGAGTPGPEETLPSGVLGDPRDRPGRHGRGL